MAQTEHLPIYKKSYDLCLCLEQVVRSFSRYHKYTLGADLREGARRVLKLIVRANARRDKTPLLLEVREEVEQLKGRPVPRGDPFGVSRVDSGAGLWRHHLLPGTPGRGRRGRRDS
jgi:hypothetical protein